MHSQNTGAGFSDTVNGWSRMLGVTVRPWSGHSPISLIVRGAVNAAIGVFFIVLALRMLSPNPADETAVAMRSLRGLAIGMLLTAIIIALMGCAKILVGVLDLAPRQSVVGTVFSLHDRKFLDFLPTVVRHAIFQRHDSSYDRRRTRYEVVLATATGHRQWTVRKSAMRALLTVGTTVRLTVSPLAGYVASVDPLPAMPPPV